MTTTILVTGATGFIGSHLCRKLSEEGFTVRAFARNPSQASKLKQLGINIVQGDLLDRQSLEHATEGVEIIYHMAAEFQRASTPAVIRASIVDGTKYLLDSAIRAGVRRFVHGSSTGVYGFIATPPATEETKHSPIPNDPYIVSKIRAEQYIAECAAAGAIKTTIVRACNVYGPRDRKFLKLFKMIQNRIFVTVGPGNHLYPMLHIDDFVNSLIQCGMNPKAVGQAYNFVGAPTTYNQMVQAAIDVLGIRPITIHVPFKPVYLAGVFCEGLCRPFHIPPPLSPRRVNAFRVSKDVDTSKARTELGFEPITELHKGMAQTVAWYRTHGWL